MKFTSINVSIEISLEIGNYEVIDYNKNLDASTFNLDSFIGLGYELYLFWHYGFKFLPMWI